MTPENLKNGQEQHEKFKRGKKIFVQYDYRHTNGELFSTVAPSLKACRARKDAWLERSK